MTNIGPQSVESTLKPYYYSLNLSLDVISGEFITDWLIEL